MEELSVKYHQRHIFKNPQNFSSNQKKTDSLHQISLCAGKKRKKSKQQLSRFIF